MSCSSLYYLVGRYDNILYGSDETFILSSENVNFPIENSYDGLTNKTFRFNAAAANDYVGIDANRVKNGDMETWTVSVTPDNWDDESTGTSTLSEETTLVNSGASALKLTGGATGIAIPAQTITMVPGMQFTATVAVRGDGTNTTNVYIQCLETKKYLKSDGTWIASKTAFVARSTATYATTTASNCTMEAYSVFLRPTARLKLTAELTGSGAAGYIDDFYVWPHYNFASLHGHNIDPSITTTLRTDTASNFATETTRKTFTYQQPSMFVYNATLYTDRYIRVFFSGTNNDPISVGELWVGHAKVFSRLMEYGWKREHAMPVVDNKSFGGQLYRTSLALDAPRKLDFSFKATNTTESTEALSLWERSKFGNDPIVMVPIDTRSEVIHGRLLSPVSFVERAPRDFVDFSLDLIEDSFSISVG